MVAMMNMETGGGGRGLYVPNTINKIQDTANAVRNVQNAVNTVLGTNTDTPTATAPTTPTRSSSGNGSSAAAGGTDYNLGYLDYLSAAMAARQQAIANANAALDKQGSAIEQRYKNQMNEVGQDYQKLKNQSELNRYKSLRSLRETQANRGLLNSGAGRQENLNVNATYGNALNEIGMQEQNELNRIQQAINEMWAQIATQKAQNEASISGDFTSGLISALSNPLYQYGGVSDDAKALAATQLNQNPAVANGMFKGLSSAQLQALFQQDNQANLLRNLGSVYSNINY